MNELIPVRHLLNQAYKQATQFDMVYIVLIKYRCDRWKQLLEVVLDLDPKQHINQITGSSVEVTIEDDHKSSHV